LKVSGPLGLELDSLADMVTVEWYPDMWCFLCFQIVSMKSQRTSCCRILDLLSRWVLVTVWLYSTSIRQTNSFIGLPTPANALFILSLPLVLKYSDSLIVLEIWQTNGFINNHTFSAYILNAEIPLFSLKIKSLISKITHYKLASAVFFSVVVFFNMPEFH
jgi:CDP-diacylglycerol--serine O-phosphatidyltransferase